MVLILVSLLYDFSNDVQVNFPHHFVRDTNGLRTRLLSRQGFLQTKYNDAWLWSSSLFLIPTDSLSSIFSQTYSVTSQFVFLLPYTFINLLYLRSELLYCMNKNYSYILRVYQNPFACVNYYTLYISWQKHLVRKFQQSLYILIPELILFAPKCERKRPWE